MAALSQQPEAEMSLNEVQALRDFATVIDEAGNFAKLFIVKNSDTEILFKRAMEVRIKILGMINGDTERDKHDALHSMSQLAIVYYAQCRWSEAEKLGLEVVEKSQSELGLKHLCTLQFMASLGKIYLIQHRLDKAEEIHLQVCRALITTGAPYSRRLSALSSLAQVYSSQGRMKKALIIQIRIVSELEMTGLDPHTAVRYKGDLAATLHKIGRVKEAIEMDMQNIEESERICGAQHDDTLWRRYQLYLSLLLAGQPEKALENLMQLLPAVIQGHGQDFPLTLIVMTAIARAWISLGRFDEAERMASEALELFRTGSSLEGVLSFKYMELVVCNLHIHDRNTKAKEVLLPVIAKRLRLLGVEHEETVRSVVILASIQSSLAKQSGR